MMSQSYVIVKYIYIIWSVYVILYEARLEGAVFNISDIL